ncbi:MAG TPA: YDG domain-containing protein [Bacteroidales bacterium]|nr:YDG domain-containing protein [Bacteroidales bacterium]
METIYKPKRLRRAGAVIAALFTILLLSSYVAEAQLQTSLYVDIECYGIVKAKNPGDIEVVDGYFNGPSICDAPLLGENDEIWALKPVASTGYSFVGWATTGYDTPLPYTLGPPPYPLTGNPDPEGFTWAITMAGDKHVKAIFEMNDLPDPGMFMSDGFSIRTIPGTDDDAKGTPLIVPLTATYPTIPDNAYPGVRADALLSTDREGGFSGLRILDISPAPGVVGTIDLGTVAGVYGVYGNDILLSDIFDLVTVPSDFIAPLLEDESGKTINWVFTFDGFMEAETFTVTVSTIAYKDAALEFGDELCETVLASSEFDIEVADVEQTFTPELSPIIECGGPFEFSTTITYPTIYKVDLAGEILANAILKTDKAIPAGATITWTYTQTPGGSFGPAVFTVGVGGIPANTPVYLSNVVVNSVPAGVAPTPLLGHSELDIEWEFSIANLPSGSYNLTVQPIVQLNAVDYPYGEVLSVELINLDITASVNIGPTAISAVTKAPIIVPVTTTLAAPFSADHAGIMLDGRITKTSGNFPSGMVLLGARYGATNPPTNTITIIDGVLGGTSGKKFSQMFGSPLIYPYDLTAISGTTLYWEFDIEGVSAPVTFDMDVELFTYYGTSPICIVGTDNVDITFANASFTATTPNDYVCLNDIIPITVTFDFPAIASIEPTAYDIYTDVVIKNTAHEIPAGTTIDWHYGATASGLFTVGTALPVNTETMLSAIIAGSTSKVGTVPDKLINAVDVAWTFNFVIPGNYDPPTDLTGAANKGDYTLNFKPIVKLFAYPNFVYMTSPDSRNVSFTIGTYALTMAAEPDYAGTTNPEIPGPYNIGCGTLVKVIATPSVLGGYFFDEWTSETDCEEPEGRDIPAYDNFADYEANPTWYRMPPCNAEVTAHFDQEEYEFVIGVAGCGQKVIVWTDGGSTPFELTGNRECADIEPTSGTFLTFTHGETVLLEVIPTTGWTWGEWIFCDPADDGEPLGDPDFTYIGLNDAGHHVYELVFRSDKELKALFRKNLTANIVINNKIYDGTTTATIDQEASTLTGYSTTCPGYDCTVDFDWVGVVANFIDENTTWNGTIYLTKQVNITGLELTGIDDCYYILGATTYDPLTGYGVPGSTATSAAKIFRKCVDVYAKADNKIYDGNTNAVVSKNEPTPYDGVNDGFKGFLAGDNVSGTINPAGTFASKNIGTWNVTYSATLSGTDAPNYVLNCPEGAGYPVIQATISCKWLTLPNIVIADKQFNGQVEATVLSYGALSGLIAGETLVYVTPADPADAEAYFVNPWVEDDKDVEIVNLGLSGAQSGNYCIGDQGDDDADIVAPPYAMFDPSYQLSCDPECEPDIVEVPVERTFTITFNQDVYNYMGQPLPTSGTGLGNFIRLEKYIVAGEPPCHEYIYPDPDNWATVPFWSIRAGRVITVYPGTPENEVRVDLQWNNYYRIVFGDIWAHNNITGDFQRVEYRLDQDDYEFDEEAACAFELSRQIIFKTIPQLISPVVEPSGCEDVEIAYNAPIKITFVNPVKYTNGNMISDQVGEPTHKFEIWASPKYGPEVWKKVMFKATASEYEEALPGYPGTFGPTVITLVPEAFAGNEEYWTHPYNQMLHCYNYYVLFRDGFMDNGAGFIDMTDGGRVASDGPGGGADLVWSWCTTCKFDITVSYSANSGLKFPPSWGAGDINNLFLKEGSATLKNLNVDGSAYGSYGKQLTYKVNMLPYPHVYTFKSNIGQGYHINNWTRNLTTSVYYKSGSGWKYQNTLPGLGWELFTNQNQTPAAPAWPTSHPFIDWTADPAVPFEGYRFNVDYNINTYNIYAKAVPYQDPSTSGVSWTGNTNSWVDYDTKNYTHGSAVMIKAKAMDGYYNTSWSYAPPSSGKQLPASVLATIGPNDVTNYTYDPELPAKPNFVTPKEGFITFDMVGTDPVHGYTYTVEANFAKFYPRIDVTVVPESPDCNYVTYTAQFVQGQDWGIVFAAQNYAVFKYGTPVTLETHECECGWMFDHFEVWDGTMVGSERHYVLFTPTEWMPVESNLDIKAVFVKKPYHITAVTDPNTKGSVLIEGENSDGDFVQLIDAEATAGDYFDFDTPLTLTVYPEPGWECVGFNNDNVYLVEEYIDRSVWSYIVGDNDCEQPYDLVAELALRQYVIKGLPYYNNTQNTTGGKVTGAPAGTGLNKFTNNSTAGTAIGTFEHFQHPTPFTLTATANTYYKLSHWYDVENGVSLGSANPLSLPMVNADRTIRAIFVVDLPTYALTVTHDPEVAGDESVTQNGYTAYEPYAFYKHNQLSGFPSVISVTAIPEIGWEFDYWTSSLFTGKNYSNPYVFNMPNTAVTMVAHYKKIDYELDLVCRTYLRPVDPCNCNIVDYGLLLEDVTPGSDGIYNFGDVVTLKATPIPGFTFVNWMVGTLSDLPGCGELDRDGGNCILTGWQIDPVHAPRPYPQTMTFTYTIPAQWEETVVFYALAVETAFPQYPIYSLTTSDNPDGFGNTWGDGNYPETVVAMVDQEETTPGWGFMHWDVNYTTQAEGVSPLGIYMDENKVAVAHYELIEYELNLVAIGCGSVYAQDWDYMYNIEDDPLPISAEEDCCNYEFVGWFYDYNCNVPVTDATGTPITAPNFGWIPQPYDVTIYGLFEETYFDVEITMARDECESGLLPAGCTAEVISGSGPYALDEVITLLATPGPGYVFDYWANPMCEVLVEDEQFNHTILCEWNDFVAVFDAIPYNVTLTANPTAGGTVAGGGIYYIGDNVTVTATPTVGWVFNGWYQGTTLVSPNLAYSFVMPAANVALEAKFTITTVTLTVTIDGPSSCSVVVKNGATVLTPPYTVNYGTVLTLDPEPNGLFLNWTGDLTGTANPASLTMNGNKTVVAHFAACDPVTNLASTTTAKTAEVTWTTPAGQTAELRYKKAVGGTWTAWAVAASPKTITGLTPGTLYNVEVRTVCGTGIYAEVVAGTFTTKLLGDVNCDGFLTVLDVQILTNYIMGSQAWTQCIGDGGDINGDGQINVLDIVALINIILGQTGKASVMSIPADIYLASDGIMFNSDGTVSGLQFELEGPQVSNLKLTLALAGYELTYSVEGNTLTGMIYNLDNEPIPAGMINLISMAAEGTIEWGNVIGANYGENEVQVTKHGALSDAFSLMAYPNPTRGEINALFNVPANAKVNIRLLDFSGRVISELTDAIYDYGEHLINWTDAQTLTTGLYILQMNAITEDASHQVYRQEVKVVIIK